MKYIRLTNNHGDHYNVLPYFNIGWDWFIDINFGWWIWNVHISIPYKDI